MSALVLRLAGPMQSWGTQSRFTVRDTGFEPSKSGVLGLLCAARGIAREDDDALAELAALEMGVRVDRQGVFSVDYHTAGGGDLDGARYGVVKADGKKGDPVVSHRHYLADAEFHVALEAKPVLLNTLEKALADPVWPLYLGRKAFTPTAPLCLGVHEGSVDECLRRMPWRKRRPWEEPPERLRLSLECGPGQGAARMDHPLSFANGRRRFAVRHVRTAYCTEYPVADSLEEMFQCISRA